MTVAVTTGVVDPVDRLTDEIQEGASNALALVNPEATPLWSILNGLPTPAAKQYQVRWFYGQEPARHATLAASATSADVALVLDTGEASQFTSGDYLVLGKGEVVAITAVSADGITLGVTRSVGSVSAVSAQSGSQVMRLPAPISEGASVATQRYAQNAMGFNYTSIFRNSLQLTGTADETATHGSSKETHVEIAQRLTEQNLDIENQLFWGAMSLDTSGTHPQHTLGGFADLLAGGLTDGIIAGAQAAVGFSVTAFHDLFEAAFGAGTKKKALFVGPRAAAALQVTFLTNWLPNLDHKTAYGVRVDAWLNTPWGAIPVFVQNGWTPYRHLHDASAYVNLASGPSSAMFLVDLGLARLRPLRKQALVEDRQNPGEDKAIYEWVSEVSLEIGNPFAHRYVAFTAV